MSPIHLTNQEKQPRPTLTFNLTCNGKHLVNIPIEYGNLPEGIEMGNLFSSLIGYNSTADTFQPEYQSAASIPITDGTYKSLSKSCEELSASLERNGRTRTARAYRCAVKRFLAFCRKPRISVHELTETMIKRYENHLLEDGLKMNTVSFYMRNLRAVCNKSLGNGEGDKVFSNLFANVFTGVSDTRRRALDRKDMLLLQNLSRSVIENKSFSGSRLNPRLHDSLLYFMFSYYARGISFIDLAFLRKTDIDAGVISYKRKKTGGYFQIKITDPMREIIDHFRDRCPNSKYIFPLVDPNKKNERRQYENQLYKQNVNLRKLTQVIGLRKKITTHVARHTFATLAKKANISIAVISEALGHKEVETTYKYLDSFDRSTLDNVSEFMSKLLITKDYRKFGRSVTS